MYPRVTWMDKLGSHQPPPDADGGYAFISNCGPSPWGHPAPFGLLSRYKMWSWEPGDVSATMRALELAPNGPSLQRLLTTGQGRCAAGLDAFPNDPELAWWHALPCIGDEPGDVSPDLKFRDVGCWVCKKIDACRFDHAYIMLERAHGGDRAKTPWLRDDGGRWWADRNGHKPAAAAGRGSTYVRPRRYRRPR